MFDNVGRNLDEEASKRTAASLLITGLVFAGGIGFSIGLAAYTVAEVVLDLADDEDMIEVSMEDVDLDDAPPPPPPPPPPPAAADAEEEDDEEDEPDPDEMDEDIKDLDEQVKEEVKAQDKPKGVAGGVEGGVEGGVVGGVVGGVIGGVLGGQLGGVRVFHHSELEVKKRFYPTYPEAARPLNLGDQRCKIKVWIDTKGIPYQAKVEDCPKVFHEEARKGILKWRWYPTKVGREKVKAQTVVVFNFKIK